MSKTLNPQNERSRELARILLDIRDATGGRFKELLELTKISSERWEYISTSGHLSLDEAFKICCVIGVELDYFVHCSVHMGAVAQRFENEVYDPTTTRSKFTRKIMELSREIGSTVKVNVESGGCIQQLHFCHS